MCGIPAKPWYSSCFYGLVLTLLFVNLYFTKCINIL